jgi:broad specificity phosphatase PhoE
MPVVDVGVPPHRWSLSAEGRDEAMRLASDLSTHGITTIVSSEEPKCKETAAAIANRLRLPWGTAPDLHEHRRDVMKWHGETEWNELLRRFFNSPEELVFGDEAAGSALRRFTAAIYGLIDRVEDADGALAIVTHGTVMSLFVAQQLGVDPFAFWRQLKLPDYVELEVNL